MSTRLKVPPTKSALLQLKRQVDFLQQGHDMLERKRDLLTRLVYERLHQYRKMRGRFTNTPPAAGWASRICAWARRCCNRRAWRWSLA